MSASSYRSELARIQRDIGDIRNRIANENQSLARAEEGVNSAMRSANSSRDFNAASSYLRQAESKQKDAVRYMQAIATLEKQMADKQTALNRVMDNLRRAEEQEARDRDREHKRVTDTQLQRSRELTRETEKRAALEAHMRREAMNAIMALPEQITVLFCAADPRGATHLLLDEEVRAITEKIRASKHRDSVDLKSAWAVRTSDLLQSLNEFDPDVVHFSGHGTEEDEIVFLDAAGNPKFVSKDAIVSILASSASKLRLVVFNTCFSKNQAESITGHVEAAIGMADSIEDGAARNFAASFYSAIGFGHSIQVAFNQAIAFLKAENPDEAGIPTLFTKEGVDANEIVLVKPTV